MVGAPTGQTGRNFQNLNVQHNNRPISYALRVRKCPMVPHDPIVSIVMQNEMFHCVGQLIRYKKKTKQNKK